MLLLTRACGSAGDDLLSRRTSAHILLTIFMEASLALFPPQGQAHDTGDAGCNVHQTSPTFALQAPERHEPAGDAQGPAVRATCQHRRSLPNIAPVWDVTGQGEWKVCTSPRSVSRGQVQCILCDTKPGHEQEISSNISRVPTAGFQGLCKTRSSVHMQTEQKNLQKRLQSPYRLLGLEGKADTTLKKRYFFLRTYTPPGLLALTCTFDDALKSAP